MVRDDEGSLGRVSLLTIKASRTNDLVFRGSEAYSMVNTWRVLGRTGDWKNSWPHTVVSVSLGVSLTGLPSSMV